MTCTKMIFTLVLGVYSLKVATCWDNTDQYQSQPTNPEERAELQSDVGQRRIDTPEVVLQLKYDGGELNRIYLAQYRKGAKSWVPSVPARTVLCSDLCHAGLGGDPCGTTCSDLIPVGLQSALHNPNRTEVAYGEPRVSVCPTLCDNKLGSPLCSCAKQEAQNDVVRVVDWSAVCAIFCLADRFVLGGCPECQETSTTQAQLAFVTRALSTNEGWVAWCNVQCRQGQGGAACNCDRTPFQ